MTKTSADSDQRDLGGVRGHDLTVTADSLTNYDALVRNLPSTVTAAMAGLAKPVAFVWASLLANNLPLW